MSNFEHVSYHMTGRIAMLPREAALVEKYAALCETWVEIGTLWGGSAILAALARPDISVITIDPMTGYYGSEDDGTAGLRAPNVRDLQSNLQLFDVADRVKLIQASSDPFPPDIVVDGMLVDGAHDYDSVLHDCREACQHARKYILCHDINDTPVARAVDDGIEWGTWREVEASACMRIFEHV